MKKTLGSAIPQLVTLGSKHQTILNQKIYLDRDYFFKEMYFLFRNLIKLIFLSFLFMERIIFTHFFSYLG